jgi:hypothetical protein
MQRISRVSTGLLIILLTFNYSCSTGRQKITLGSLLDEMVEIT